MYSVSLSRPQESRPATQTYGVRLSPQHMSLQAPTDTDPRPEPRTPLTKERVLRAAITLADAGGVESLSMRKLAHELGVEAMSLYNHVRNKDDILDGIVEVVIGEIEVCPRGADWKRSMRHQVMSARKVLLRHPWAPPVIESRTGMSPAMLRYMDAVIGTFREGGFSIDLTHHAIHSLGSRVLGFTQELFDDSRELTPAMAEILARELAARYPYAAEMAVSVTHDGGLGGCDDNLEFEFGLDLILDGFERQAVSARDQERSGEQPADDLRNPRTSAASS
jgi:AcrR family transcriptional regulator